MSKSKGVILNGEKLSWEQAFTLAATDPLRPWPYTPDMLAQLSGLESAEPDDAAFSPSRLLSCHRGAVLRSRSEAWVDADSSWPLVRGNMVHALMERSRYPGAFDIIREQRLTTQVETRYGPVEFTAKPDLVVINRVDWSDEASDEASADDPDGADAGRSRVLQARERLHIKVVDYKSKSAIKHDLVEVSTEHGLQVNMYAYILRRELPALLGMPGARVQLDELEIDYVDMSRVRRFTSAGWLHDRGKRLSVRPLVYDSLHLAPIPLFNQAVIERFVRRRIEERIAAYEQLPAQCETESGNVTFCSTCRAFDAHTYSGSAT